MFYTKIAQKRESEVPKFLGDLSPNPLTQFAVTFITPQLAALSNAPLSKVKGLEKESVGVLFPGLRGHCCSNMMAFLHYNLHLRFMHFSHCQ